MAQTRRGPARLPPQPQLLTAGARVTEKQAGEENETAAKLIAGDSSGEAGGATTFSTIVRNYWCPQLKLVLWLQGLVMSNGGARPRHGWLRRDDGVAALYGNPTSFSSAPRT